MALILLWRSKHVRRRHKTRNSTTETNVNTMECREKFSGLGEAAGTAARSREGNIWGGVRRKNCIHSFTCYSALSTLWKLGYLSYDRGIQAFVGIGGPPHTLRTADNLHVIDGLHRGRRCICQHLIVFSADNFCLVAYLRALAHLDIVRGFLYDSVGVLDVRIAASYRTA